MLKRTIFHALQSWSKRQNRKPLILRGARQVGKTTIINAFADHYDQFLSLNLEKKADRDLFEQDYDIDELIAAIHFHKNQSINPKAKTLLFIDEIQYCPSAVTALRYLYEEHNEIHVIAAGSLLETLINRQISFPVGRVEYQWIYPLSFSEYLSATQPMKTLDIFNNKPCPAFAHKKLLKLLKLFYEYTLVGGMPEAVTT